MKGKGWMFHTKSHPDPHSGDVCLRSLALCILSSLFSQMDKAESAVRVRGHSYE